MKTGWRVLMFALCAGLLVSIAAMHLAITQSAHRHDTEYRIVWPWLLQVRDGSLLALILWCIVFVRRDPLVVRAGLAVLFIAFLLSSLPVKQTFETIIPSTPIGAAFRH